MVLPLWRVLIPGARDFPKTTREIRRTARDFGRACLRLGEQWKEFARESGPKSWSRVGQSSAKFEQIARKTPAELVYS